MLQHGSVARSGDCVLLYESPLVSHIVQLTPGKNFQNKFGSFLHNDIIGLAYGSKVYSSSTSSSETSWMFVFMPTPDQWSMSLRHRTQIMYPTDIAVVLSQLRVKPGSIVFESGTGSGSLSCSFVRTVGAQGHLHTFEFNKQRVIEAREDFAKLGLMEQVTVYWRDVCTYGFPKCEGVDAIFLDLPSPHVEPLVKSLTCLKPFGRVCSFSPCIEQVSRMCVELAKNEFQGIYSLYFCLKCRNYNC